jgi:hypothetical protein
VPDIAEEQVHDKTDDKQNASSPMDYLPSDEPRKNANGSRQEILARKIIDLLGEQPGLFQKDVFRLVSEKDILVLSLLDQLVGEGLIERRGEPSQLYLVGDAPLELATAGQTGSKPRAGGGIYRRVENALILLDLYRLCYRKLGLRIEVGKGFRAFREGRKVLSAAFGPSGSELTLYSLKKEQLADLRPTLESAKCEVIDGDDSEACVLIRGHNRSSLFELLSTLSSALPRTK